MHWRQFGCDANRSQFVHSHDERYFRGVLIPYGLIICAASLKKLSLWDDQDRKPSRREGIP